MKRYMLLPGLLMLCFSAFGQTRQLQSGTWRAALKTEAGPEIPFLFEVSGNPAKLAILNGEERLRVDDLQWKGDSLIIRLPLFDTEIRALLTGNMLRGSWVKHLATRDVPMPFMAVPGVTERFPAGEMPFFPLNGRWSATFTDADGTNPDVTVAEFRQTGTKVTGTFLTTTGDYRFLEGRVSGDQLMLSCFDGSHAFLFTGTLKDERTVIDGKFYSGLSSVSRWTARKDAKAALPDAYALTALKPGFTKIDFSFPNLYGKNVSLSDPRFQGKVTIIQFMGSWCPNCMDETNYLVPFYKKYHDKGVEIVGLAYERFTDPARAKKNILQLKNRLGVPYDLLVTGVMNDKAEVQKSIPALANFAAFPTTVIINKKGQVARIHTGFSGPGTGKYYQEFTTEFEQLIDGLLAQK